MAIGGALRAALRAGNWAKTAMESRRRARALADLNARGGIRGPVMDTGEGLAARGFDFFEDGGRFARGTSSPNRPRFDVIRDPATGNRRVYPNPPGFGTNPIQAPYEGFRVFPADGLDPSPQWMGRGRAPWTDQPWMESHGFPDYYRPYDPMNPEVFGDLSYLRVPPAFGGAPAGPLPAQRPAVPPTRFSFNDYFFR